MTSKLDKNHDWTFGIFIKESEEIAQNVKTRLLSFKNDWFLDTDQGIDWIDLLGRKNSKETINREVERVVLTTDGVLELISLEIVQNKNRSAIIQVKYKDIYMQIREIEETI